jgi:hypothetical protein
MTFMDKGLKRKRQSLPNTRWKVQEKLKKFSNIQGKWAVYCPKCFKIVNESVKKPTTATCNSCNYSINKKIAKGKCMFMYLSVKDQIKAYLKNKHFRQVLRKFGAMKGSHLGGYMHRGLVTAGHFDLSLGIDAAQLHNTQKSQQILPAVLFFNNVPASWQLRYPILAALWTGASSDKPPREVFLKKMQEELREMGTSDPIKWKDDLGDRRRSYTFLTTVISDGPEKADLLNQVGCNGQYACPFCFVRGETLTRAKWPHVFTNNPYRRTTGEDSVQGTRFPILIHEKRFPWRKSAGRLRLGRRAALKVAAADKEINDFNDTNGIKGFPALMKLPRFEETDSHVSDTLHLIAHGVFNDIIKVMVNGEIGKGHTFKTPTNSSFKEYDRMMDTMTRVSESDRNCKYLDNFSDWKAYDAMQFLLHDVALLCSNEDVIKSTAVYECLVHLANMTYLAHYGRQSEEIIKKHGQESKKLSKLFVSTLTHEYTTYKVHICICHGTDFLKIHGCAAFTDGFNLERFISCLKKLVTTNKGHVSQLVRNFLLKHHSLILERMSSFCPEAQEVLRENGFFTEEFFSKFDDVVKIKHPDSRFPPQMKALLDQFVFGKLRMGRDTDMVRVTKMTRKSFILETQEAVHPANSKIRDSYIQLEGGIFGQVAEICYLPDAERFVFILRKFKKLAPRYKDTATIVYPINQIPFYDDVASAQYHIFVLTEDLFVQKAQVSASNYFDLGRRVRIFSVYPNEWFRY